MDDLSGKINELFSNPESMDKIRNLIGMLSNNGAGNEPKEEEKSSSKNDFSFDTDTLMKIQKALSIMKKDDPRVEFLLALKPNLSESRAKRIDEAIHLMRLINLIPLLQEGNFL